MSDGVDTDESTLEFEDGADEVEMSTADGFFTITPDCVAFYPDGDVIDRTTRSIYHAIRQHSRGKKVCWPGQKRLGLMVGGLSTRQVQRSISKLRKLGLLRVRRRGLTQTNYYSVPLVPQVIKDRYARFQVTLSKIKGSTQVPIKKGATTKSKPKSDATPMSHQESSDATPMSHQDTTPMSHLDTPPMSPKVYQGEVDQGESEKEHTTSSRELSSDSSTASIDSTEQPQSLEEKSKALKNRITQARSHGSTVPKEKEEKKAKSDVFREFINQLIAIYPKARYSASLRRAVKIVVMDEGVKNDELLKTVTEYERVVRPFLAKHNELFIPSLTGWLEKGYHEMSQQRWLLYLKPHSNVTNAVECMHDPNREEVLEPRHDSEVKFRVSKCDGSPHTNGGGPGTFCIFDVRTCPESFLTLLDDETRASKASAIADRDFPPSNTLAPVWIEDEQSYEGSYDSIERTLVEMGLL